MQNKTLDIEELFCVCQNIFNITYGTNTNTNKAYFECVVCGYNTPIAPGAIVIDRTFEDTQTNTVINKDSSLFKYCPESSIYPHTSNLRCSDKSCNSKDFTFIRVNNSYSTVYICTKCKALIVNK